MKRFIVIVLAVGFLLVACTGKEEISGTDTKMTEEIAQGVTDTTVKVGNGIAVSGALAFVGIPFQQGIQSYFNMVNEEGGINGREIVYVHKDDEFKPELGIAVLEEMVYDEEVFAIVGHFGTPVVGATLPDLRDYGIPAVYFATGIGQLYNDNAVEGNGRNIFPVQPIYTMEGRIMVAYAIGQFDAKTIGVIYSNDEAGTDILKGIEIEAEARGITVIAESIPVGAVDATAQVTKIKNANVDVIIAAAIQATFPPVVKEMEKQGLMKPVVTTYVNNSASITTTNAQHIPNLVSNPDAGVYALGWVEIDETNEQWINFAKYMAALDVPPEGMNAYAMTGWIAAHFFTEGLRRVGDEPLTWENFMTALEESPIQNPFGGQIDFSDGKRFGTQEMNLSKMNPDLPVGWELVTELQSMETILGN